MSAWCVPLQQRPAEARAGRNVERAPRRAMRGLTQLRGAHSLRQPNGPGGCAWQPPAHRRQALGRQRAPGACCAHAHHQKSVRVGGQPQRRRAQQRKGRRANCPKTPRRRHCTEAGEGLAGSRRSQRADDRWRAKPHTLVAERYAHRRRCDRSSRRLKYDLRAHSSKSGRSKTPRSMRGRRQPEQGRCLARCDAGLRQSRSSSGSRAEMRDREPSGLSHQLSGCRGHPPRSASCRGSLGRVGRRALPGSIGVQRGQRGIGSRAATARRRRPPRRIGSFGRQRRV